MRSSKLWLLFYDLHYPKHNKRTWAAAMDFARQNPLAGFLYGGDQFHNDEISHHNNGKPLYKPVGCFKENTLGFHRDILSPLEAVLPKDCTKVWLIGNHDRWEDDMAEGHPEFKGMVDRPTTLDLADRGWVVVPNGKAYRISPNLKAIHGDQLQGIMGYMSMTPARRAVDLYGNVVFGHTHLAQSFSKVSPVETRKKQMAWNIPAGCDLNPEYMKNRPSGWVSGFGIGEMWKGGFNVYPVVVTDGRFSYGGKVYGKK